MNNTFEIPTIYFTKDHYSSEENEIIINLNDERELDHIINDHQKSHRRLIPQLNLISPSGTIANFSNPRLEGWEIILQGSKCNVRLTYK